MDADELIARLAAEGELESKGGFTLDPAVALEKLREFQLRDPTRFVLHWVRAANLLGASRVDIEIDADDVWFRFDGETLGAADFESLWAAAVTSGGTDRRRACRELALGINGALHWQAKGVTIRSGAAEVSVSHAFALQTRALDEAELEQPANYVHAKRPLGWDLIGRKRLDRRGQLPEELLLARACAHGRVPVWLEGKRLNPTPEPPPDAWMRVEINEHGRRGVLWLRPNAGHGRSRLRVLVSGVEVELVDLSQGQGCVEAVVDDPQLPLDLAQEKIVTGERYHELLDGVSQARWRAWFALAEAQGWTQAGTVASGELSGARRLLIADMLASPDTRWTQTPAAMAFAAQVRLERAVTDPYADYEALDATAEELRQQPPLRPTPLPEPGPLSLAGLVRSVKERGIGFMSPRHRPKLAFVPELPVPELAGSVGLRALGAKVIDRSKTEVEYRVESLEHRQVLGDAAMPAPWLELRRRRGAHELRLAWLRRPPPDRAGALELVSGDRCHARFRLPPSWGPLWAQVDGPFPDEGDDEGEVAGAILLVLERYHDLVAGLEGEGLDLRELHVVRAYLREAWGRWSGRRLMELEELSLAARLAAVEGWRGGWGVPEVWVDPPPEERAGCQHPIMNLAWLRQGERSYSLRDLQRELAVSKSLSWVERGAAPDRAPPEVWRLDAGERVIITEIFANALEPFDAAAWARRQPGTLSVPAQLEGASRAVALSGEAGERGILGIPAGPLSERWQRPPRRGARLQLLVRGHALGWMDLPLPTGPFFGVIEVPGARAAPHVDRAVKDAAWQAAAALVGQAAEGLAREQVEAWSSGAFSVTAEERGRVHDWLLDLERGAWPSVAAALRSWQARLPADHPLRVELT